MNKCDCEANKSIKCSVTQCKNHCQTSDYCSLSSIQVGTHEANVRTAHHFSLETD